MSFILNFYNSYKRKQYNRVMPINVLILHQFPRALRAPSASPFCLKLETWMRMANIQFENNLSYVTSPKGKMPWISLRTEEKLHEISDSHFCIEFLSKQYNVDLNSHLSDEQKGIARAFVKMAEESLNWILLLHRYIYRRSYQESSVPDRLASFYSSTVKKGTFLQGYGRHTMEEVYSMGKADLKAINDFIGNKKFLFGDKVCEADACIFAMIAQFIHHTRGVLHDFINNECPNILRYFEAIKNEYWKDWDENTIEGKKRKNKPKA